MFRKIVFCAMLTLGAACAATYNVTLRQPATIQGTQLKPGEYRLELDSNKVRFVRGKLSAEAPVKIETVEKKFTATSIVYNGGSITEICLGGTKTKLTLE